jgi:hypothetical protein
MEIKPTYVTFEQAKLLKEKGFDIECRNYYDNSEEICEVSNRFTKNMNSLQTAFLEIAVFPEDADINDKDFIVYSAPEQWQVIEWLRINHGMYVEARLQLTSKNHKREYIAYIDCIDINYNLRYLTPQEAYSAAFDYILNNLI